MSLNLGSVSIRMTSEEKALLQRMLYKSEFYLEYGCGGSTEMAIELVKNNVVSIESDQSWVDSLKVRPRIQHSIDVGKLKLIHVDIGPVGDWGVPLDETKIRSWGTYYTKPFTSFDFLYDFILIDGRFRHSCAYACYALAGESAKIAIHDYSVRAGYSEIERFFNILEVADTLVVLEKKRHILQRNLYLSIYETFFRP